MAHGPDDVRLDLPQLRVLRERRLRLHPLCKPAPHLGDVGIEEARERHRLLGRAADEARGTGDPVSEHEGLEAAGLRDGARAAVERGREAALCVGERHVDPVGVAAGLDEAPERLLELVLAELELERPDHGDRDHGDPGERLLRIGKRGQVVREDLTVLGQRAQLVLPCLDRLGIVLSRPAA